MKATSNKNCLNCKFFVTCRDKKKAYDYRCEKYKKVGITLNEEGGLLMPQFSHDPYDSVKKNSQDSRYNALELDLSETLEVFDSTTKVPYDLKIDDRDMKEFPNFYEFVTSKEGLDIKPFARQLTMGLHVFAEWCPYCSHKSFGDIYKVPYKWSCDRLMEHVVPLRYGKCPKCKRTKLDMLKKQKLNLYEELIAVIGQRSGKSFTVDMMVAYMLHKFLKLQRPIEVYNLGKGTPLYGTFVGLTFQKAVELLWMPLHNMLRASPWFSEYHKLLQFYNEKYGDELFKMKDTYIHYGHRGLTLNPSGPNKRTLRGNSRFFYALDELGWFDNSEDNEERERTSASETYTSLDRSMKTLRVLAKNVIMNEGYYNIPMPCSFSITSPSNQRDKAMMLLKAHQNSRTVYTFHAPTWKFNPIYTKADFDKEYRENPVNAERDYGANPPLNDNPFFEGIQQLGSLFGPYKNQVDYTYTAKLSHTGQKMRAGRIRRVLKHGAIPRSVLSMDAGYSNNSFALVVSHPQKVKNRIYPKIDAMIEIPPVAKECVLNYNHIQNNLIYPLIKAFNVGFVAADRWQSKTILHNIENDFKIQAVEYSLTYSDFIDIKMIMQEDETATSFPITEIDINEIENMEMNNYPHCFRYKPVSHFYYQCLTVVDKGNTVDKGLRLTDDLFRAACLGIIWILDEDLQKVLLNANNSRHHGVIQGVGKALSQYDPVAMQRIRQLQKQQFQSAIGKSAISKTTSGKAIGAVGGRGKFFGGR